VLCSTGAALGQKCGLYISVKVILDFYQRIFLLIGSSEAFYWDSIWVKHFMAMFLHQHPHRQENLFWQDLCNGLLFLPTFPEELLVLNSPNVMRSRTRNKGGVKSYTAYKREEHRLAHWCSKNPLPLNSGLWKISWLSHQLAKFILTCQYFTWISITEKDNKNLIFKIRITSQWIHA
jgi:hypothetical protein